MDFFFLRKHTRRCWHSLPRIEQERGAKVFILFMTILYLYDSILGLIISSGIWKNGKCFFYEFLTKNIISVQISCIGDISYRPPIPMIFGSNMQLLKWVQNAFYTNL